MIVAIVTNIGTILVLIWFMLRVDRLLREHPSHQTEDKSGDDSWHSWRFWNPPSSDDNEDELDADSQVINNSSEADEDVTSGTADRYTFSTREGPGKNSSQATETGEESSRDE